jgi:hypothetical protein
MKQKHADGLLEMLDEYGWFDGQTPYRYKQGEVCLAMALTRYGTQAGLKYKVRNGMTEDINNTIMDMYPDQRVMGLALPRSFNDHPRTTEEDVRLVIKHAVDADEDL